MNMIHRERAFEDEICRHLAANGWLYSPDDTGYDRARALFPEDLFAWMQDAAPEAYEKVFGPDAAPRTDKRTQALDRLVKQLEKNAYEHGGGTLNTLKKGLSVVGAPPFPLIQTPPADDFNPRTQELYAKNRLRVMRQVCYSQHNGNVLDLVLFCNGLPVATVELKTDATQSVENAITQYKLDREPYGEPLLQPLRGALVHFAVSLEEVHMTTSLAGKATRFLPFNRGHSNGKGNPPIEGTVPAAYFWRETLQRDTWLELLAKFVYLKHETRTDPVTLAQSTTTSVRFPRYHQWRAVTHLVAAAREEGPGHKYLIQHSAGSGKTDSIAWLAHRLASLHAPAGGNADGAATDRTAGSGAQQVFDGVIVIADRQVLDKQLQQAIGQLTTVTGTFTAITHGSDGSKSAKLADALLSGTRIIGVTLQTFPEALSKIAAGGGLAGRRYAVIADEAHSSQTGDAAAKLKITLNSAGQEVEEPVDDDEDALRTMAARADEAGRLSFFAFTATPKEATLELFGRVPEGGTKHEPFDLYPMKQAIEEGFILDVLQNYAEWKIFTRLEAESGEEIEQDRKAGRRAYAKFALHHDITIAEKTKVIIEHFTRNVQPLLGGRAKAMVVTSSRPAALRYKQAFDAIVDAENLPLKALVAFSGTLTDPDTGREVSEAAANPDAKGKALDEAFKADEFKLMIVANKYQTGFDQPLLCGMYVDKELSGVTAVQTLSRLNRVIDGKDTTYVLDFANDPERIREAFQEYYEDAQVITASEPELVFDLQHKLESAAIFTWAEVEQFYALWNAAGKPSNTPSAAAGKGRSGAPEHSAVLTKLYPARDRWVGAWEEVMRAESAVEKPAREGAVGQNAETEAEKNRLLDFRATAAQYVKAYEFFSQCVNYGDPKLEKLSAYLKLLVKLLAEKRTGEDPVDLTGVVMTHFRLEELKVHSMALEPGGAQGLQGMTEAGMSAQRKKERASRRELVDFVNELFEGSRLGETDRVSAVEVLMRKLTEDGELKAQARVNTPVDFAQSPTLGARIEDALWTSGEGVQEGLEHLQNLPVERLMRSLLKMGLQEMLREAA